MYILAIETTGKAGSVALVKVDCETGLPGGRQAADSKTLAFKTIEGSMSHLRELVPTVSAVLVDAGVSKNEISYVAASVGPGSFTGIRIGVSTVRALSQALGLGEAIAVPSLTAFMYKKEVRAACLTPACRTDRAGRPACIEHVSDGQDRQVICAIINARRGQVYGRLDGYMDDGPYMLSDMLDVIRERVFADDREVLFFGDGIDAYESQINDALAGVGKYAFADADIRYQDAESVAICAAENLEEYKVPTAELLPDYMRKAEAEQKLEAGQLPICKGPIQE